MNPPSLTLLIVLLFAGILNAAERPNIVIIFTDDQGYGDLACYGNKKNKACLDQLAKHPLHFLLYPDCLWTLPVRTLNRAPAHPK